MKKLTNANATYLNWGLLLLRLGIGFSFIYNHGFAKITDPDRWARLGGNMDEIGIHFAPAFWGFMAAFTESVGALFFGMGLFTRIVSFMLGFTMMIAFLGGFSDHEFNSHAFEMMIVFISVLIIGPGRFSIDAQISGFKK